MEWLEIDTIIADIPGSLTGGILINNTLPR